MASPVLVNQTTSPINTSTKQSDTTVSTDQSSYYLPPINIIHTWNSKRLLPHVLLSQYKAFISVFLVDDDTITGISNHDLDINNSILFGSPTEPVSDITYNYYQDSSKFDTFGSVNKKAGADYIESNLAKYYTDSIYDGTFRLSHLTGIPATIKGYNNGKPVRLIPLGLKHAQLTTPESKGLLDIQSFQADVSDINGFIRANMTIKCNDIVQLFSEKSVVSKLFQTYNRYFVIFGWQGPAIEGADMTSLGVVSQTVNGDGSLSIELTDGTNYKLHLPSPFVRNDGVLNYPKDEKDNKLYSFDCDETDNGNRMHCVFFSSAPKFKFDGRGFTVTLNLSNANEGFQFSQNLAVFGGGTDMGVIRSKIVEKVNNELKPIGFYNIKNFFSINNAGFDAESNQRVCESFSNEIVASKAGGGGLFSKTDVVITTPDKAKEIEDKKKTVESDINKKKDEAVKDVKKVVKPIVPPNFSSELKFLKIDGANVENLSPNAKSVLLSIDKRLESIKSTLPFGVRVTSGKRNGTKSSNHNTGDAVDLGSSPKDRGYEQQLERILKNDWGYSAHFEYDKQKNSNGTTAKGDHVHVNLTGIAFENHSEPEDTSDPEAPIIPEVQQQEEARRIEDGLNVKQTFVTSSDDFDGLPAAYRLGDVITICTDVIDTIISERIHQNDKTGDVKGIKDLLHKILDGTQYEKSEIINHKTIDQLEDKDIFEQSKADPTKRIKKSSFIDALQSIPEIKQIQGNDPYSIQNLLSEGQITPMAEVIGYQVVATDMEEQKSQQFKSLINHFRSLNTEIKLDSIRPIINQNLSRELYDKTFSWKKEYIESFNEPSKFFPITVADLPISVDTLSRIFQGMVYNKTPNDVITSIVNAVSIDYGFSLRAIHRTMGTVGTSFTDLIRTEYDIDTRSFFAGKKQVDRVNVKIIIDDEFLSEEFTIKAIKKEMADDEFLEYEKRTSGTIIQPEMISGESSFSNDSSRWQKDQISFLNQEYSSKKLNSLFIVDYGSMNSLVKTLDISPLGDSPNDLVTQHAIAALGERYKTTANSELNQQIMNPREKELLHNFSSLSNKISKTIIEKYNYLPGRTEFAMKQLQLVSEIFNDLLDEAKDGSGKQRIPEAFEGDVKAWESILEAVKATFNKGTDVDKQARKKFMQGVVSFYLYNLPMGVKYAFYLGKLSGTIHGTTGLGFMQGIYLRGIITQMDGIYRITNITHRIGETFETDISGTLIYNNIQNASQKLLGEMITAKPELQQTVNFPTTQPTINIPKAVLR